MNFSTITKSATPVTRLKHSEYSESEIHVLEVLGCYFFQGCSDIAIGNKVIIVDTDPAQPISANSSGDEHIGKHSAHTLQNLVNYLLACLSALSKSAHACFLRVSLSSRASQS